jgi:hypothetical protein
MEDETFEYKLPDSVVETLKVMEEVYYKIHRPNLQNKAILNGLKGEFIAFNFLKEKYNAKVYLRPNFWMYFSPHEIGKIFEEIDPRLEPIKELCASVKFSTDLESFNILNEKQKEIPAEYLTSDLFMIKDQELYLVEVKYGNPKFTLDQLKRFIEKNEKGIKQMIVVIYPQTTRRVYIRLVIL